MLLLPQRSNIKQVVNDEATLDAQNILQEICVNVCVLQHFCGSSSLDSSSIPSKVTECLGDRFAY